MAKLFTNARLYQEDEQVFRPNAWFVVANDHIVSRGTNDVPSDFSSLETTDLQDRYVMPSLINTHVHIANRVFPVGANQLIKTDEERIQNGLANLQTLQQNGVAFARALATTNDLDIDIAKRAEQQNLIGLQTAGRAITTVGGHGSKQGIVVVATPAEMRAAVRGHFLAGVDNIKLFASGGIAFSPNEQPDDVQMSFELIQAAAQAVHEKSHARLAVHEEALEGVKIALRAGADGIEHAFDADDEAINLFLKTGATLTPTLTAPYVIVKRGDGILPEWMVKTAYKWAPRHMRALGQYAKAGVKLTLGTDAGSPLNGFNDTALEAQLMVMAGATPAQVLQAATINGAELLHIESEYGHLKTGAMANFIVMDQSPLENITAVNLPTVYYKGKLVSEAPDRSGELEYPLNKGSLDY